MYINININLSEVFFLSLCPDLKIFVNSHSLNWIQNSQCSCSTHWNLKQSNISKTPTRLSKSSDVVGANIVCTMNLCFSSSLGSESNGWSITVNEHIIKICMVDKLSLLQAQLSWLTTIEDRSQRDWSWNQYRVTNRLALKVPTFLKCSRGISTYVTCCRPICIYYIYMYKGLTQIGLSQSHRTPPGVITRRQ